MRCAAYCTAQTFDTNRLFEYLKLRYEAKRIREVIHIKLATNDAHEGDVFFFPYAAFVCWGLTTEQEHVILTEVQQFERLHLDTVCSDEFSYNYAAKANITDDDIAVPNKDVLTKVAFSQAIAQSVKIDSFEKTIQRTADLAREIPERLATRGKINMSGKEIQRMMGILFLDRHSINLHQELLDTPEFFWEHTDLEPIYTLTARYLDRERRVNILNQRLTVLKELFDMLNNEFNHKQSARLEWTIIWLIVIEVLLALVTDIFHLI